MKKKLKRRTSKLTPISNYLIDYIAQGINIKYNYTSQYFDGKSIISLKETKNPNNMVAQITINQETSNFRLLIIKIDEMIGVDSREQNLFKEPIKVPDFLIFYETRPQIYLLACELKENSRQGAVEQLNAGILIGNLIVSNTRLKANATNFFNKSLKFGGLIFSNRSRGEAITKDRRESYPLKTPHSFSFIEYKYGTNHHLNSFLRALKI